MSDPAERLTRVADDALPVTPMRMAGTRLAGRTTRFDLIVPISLGVVLQTTMLQEGTRNATVLVGTVFVVHRGLASPCARHRWIRHVVRGRPRVPVHDGRVLDTALDREGISRDELPAGLRKLGRDATECVRLATLEETGHVSAIAADAPSEGRHGATARVVPTGASRDATRDA